MIRFLILCITLLGSYPALAQFKSITSLSEIPITTNTGEKPQSKIWAHAGTFWTALPDADGTHVWKLIGSQWVNQLKISDKTTSKVDCKVVGNITYVLLFHEGSDVLNSFFDLVSLEYQIASSSYLSHTITADIALGTHVETATIDMDGESRMWLAYEEGKKVRVRWSDAPYEDWTSEISLASNLKDDDICAVIALPGEIGVFWSNQNEKIFGFRTHKDGDPPTIWSATEPVIHTTSGITTKGLADDHINLAVASDGTLYCAIKTSYEHIDQPILGLFVRRPNGAWDNLYSVTKAGFATRPIVVLNEIEGSLRIIYTDHESGGNIIYKESSLDNISFENHLMLTESEGKTADGAFYLIEGFYNNVTSTKDNFTDEIVIMASSSDNASGQRYAVSVLATANVIPLPVELMSFDARLVSDNAELEWKTASELDNDYFSVESSTDGRTFTSISKVAGSGTTQLQRRYTFTDRNISRYKAAGIYYRLRQVDYNGEYVFSPVRYVSAPNLPDAITLKAFPSPFNDYLQVQITSNEESAGTLILYNAQGRVIQSQNLALNRGVSIVTFAELELASGIYFLKLITPSQQNVLKLISE